MAQALVAVVIVAQQTATRSSAVLMTVEPALAALMKVWLAAARKEVTTHAETRRSVAAALAAMARTSACPTERAPQSIAALKRPSAEGRTALLVCAAKAQISAAPQKMEVAKRTAQESPTHAVMLEMCAAVWRLAAVAVAASSCRRSA